MPRRHSWSEPFREPHATYRTCVHCELVRVTRHEPGELPWTEWERRGEPLQVAKGTPPCIENGAAAT